MRSCFPHIAKLLHPYAARPGSDVYKRQEQSSRVVRELADKLSAERRKVGKDFSTRVKEELRFLDMPNVTFSVEQLTTDFSPLGQDKIQFLISTNPGEPEKPLSKIASGGELSRIMLAIKTCLLYTSRCV